MAFELAEQHYKHWEKRRQEKISEVKLEREKVINLLSELNINKNNEGKSNSPSGIPRGYPNIDGYIYFN